MRGWSAAAERLPPAGWAWRLAGRAALVWCFGRGFLAVAALVFGGSDRAFAGLGRTNVVVVLVIALVVGVVLLLDLVRRGGDLLLRNMGVPRAVVVGIGAAAALVGEVVLHLVLAAVVP